MEFIIQFIVALFATLSFAVIFSAPKKELFYCGFTGALGWIIYYIMVQFDMGVVFPSLIATLCLTIMARIFCCGTLYACDSLSAFRYLSARAGSRNFLHGILSFY